MGRTIRNKKDHGLATARAAVAVFLCAIGPLTLFAADVIILQSEKIKEYEETISGFKSSCKCQSETISFSQFNRAELLHIVESKHPKAVFVVGIDSLRAMSGVSTIPVIYSMVLDPDKLVATKRNFTGVRMHLPPEKQFAIMKKRLPRVKRVAVLYDPAQNIPFLLRARGAAATAGIDLITLPVINRSEIPGLLNNLVDVDVLWLIPDCTMVSAATLEVMSLFSMQRKIPLVAFSEQYLSLGAALSIGLDPLDIGRQAGESAAKVVAGEDPVRIPTVDPRRGIITLNPRIAEKIGISSDRNGQPEGKEKL